MIDYTEAAIFFMKMALGLVITITLIVAGIVAMFKVEKVVTQRRQHRDMLAEIRRLKADQAYACLNDMNEYFRMELKHGQHGEAYNDALDKSWEHFHQVLSENGVHIDEEYR